MVQRYGGAGKVWSSAWRDEFEVRNFLLCSDVQVSFGERAPE